MRIGVQLPEVERGVEWDEVLAIARAAEETCYDSVWVGDHLLYRDPDRGQCFGFGKALTEIACLALNDDDPAWN